ncbi:MAG TPA: adenylate/guanylate cyclase domain-containing protein [Thermoanaerobaculia bacterium]|jgi:class 3 adenylate cyclase/tetratricopeptide (TPR) repeat protein|nr:adenylate/guanylate cyclase domain-containing protein [Thermoanaerobaculia bacterium]
MKCQSCNFDNPLGMKFCGQCGAKLAALCPQCGAEPPPGFKFCGECGSPLGSSKVEAPIPAAEPDLSPVRSYTPPHLATQILQSRSALEGERKQVTVLFCDLVGSTSLAERLGPETMHLLLNRFFELALSEVHRYEGTINQFLGDGFMALFGAPIAHEDHARRAALAALGLQKLLQEHHAELGGQEGLDLKVRMGINTGWVVVGGIGDQLRRDYTAIGDTTNLAARLQQLAEPGTILVSEDAGRLLQGSARMEPVGPLQVKGKEAPVQAFRLLGIGLLLSEQAVLDGMARSPFVGRQREMATLEELRERAAGGEGQVVGIAAEAGAGKSRLVYELRRRLWDRPVLFLAGRCISYASGMPYLPILYMLRNEWKIAETDDPAAVAAKVTVSLQRAGMEVEEALPYLLHLLGIEEGTERLAELSPQALQARIFRILRQMILNLGQGSLVVLEIEDLHWVDKTSEDFLAFLVEGLVVSRVLLLATYRSGYRPPWIEKSYATQIALSRLTGSESQAVVRHVLQRAEPSESLVEAVLSKAEGNPFFLEELTRSLLEHPDVLVPDTIQGVVMARIDRLPEEHKRLLQTASVLGREFSLPLLTQVWNQSDDLTPLLSDLKRWEFFYEEPTVEEPRYLFKHALTQEAVYQTLLKGRRQSLHTAAGQAFEQLHAGRLEDVYDTLAYHYSKAGDAEKAVSYLILFAGQAASRYAHSEAAQALREALVHCERLPEAERGRRRLELILQLAESLLPLARFPETLEIFLENQGLVDRLGDPSLAGRYYFWLAHTYSYLGDQEQAASNARLSIEAARRSGDTATEGKAWYVLCRDAFWSGRFSEGIEHGRESLALLERSDEPWWQGQAYWVAGFHHYVLGQFEEAFDKMKWAEAIWRALQDPRLDPSWSTGYFYASLGDWERGIEECQGGLKRAQDPLNTAAALGFLGYAFLEKGDLPRAIEALEDSTERLRQTGMLQLLGWFSAFLAEACLLAGRLDEAQDLAHQALDITESVRFRYGSGMAQRALGRVSREAGDPEGATRWLEAALESFQSIQAPFEMGRTRLELALVSGAGSEEAARQLGEARRIFTELRLPGYVEKAERLARELAVAPSLERSGGPNAR